MCVTYDRFASRRAIENFPAPGSFVAVAGRAMHHVCMGQGEPALVLMAGIGGDVLDWEPVMPLLAENQRVCAFDRFGQGWSDPMPQPRTLATAAAELHQALALLGIERPVLVGHSLGGAIVQIYGARYPVSGVVLVDGLTADVAEPVVARMGTYQSLDSLARLGLLRPLATVLSSPDYEDELRQQMIAIRGRSLNIRQMAVEGAAAAATGAADLKEAENGLTAPLLILAAGQSNVVPGQPPGSFARALQALADRYPDATLILFPEARHYVQAEQPEAVARAITEWIQFRNLQAYNGE